MEALDLRHRTAHAALLAITLFVIPHRAAGNEVALTAPTHGFVIHDAGEVLRDRCAWDASGRLWLTLPGGERFELIPSITDPAIVNQGDGSFHPFDPAEVQAALAAVRFPLESVSASIFILPYPRRAGLESAAGPGLILLSPGVRPLSREQQHGEFVHELGHVVQYALMPDAALDLWQSYRTMRGIEDATIYSPVSVHADRPHEIFAEDFRALFGDPLATSTGTIENSTIQFPATVPGLGGFLVDLDGAAARVGLSATPNPSRGALRFVFTRGTSAPIDVFDAAGRRVATLVPDANQGACSWDGRDAAGRPLRGVVFARVRGMADVKVRVVLVP